MRRTTKGQMAKTVLLKGESQIMSMAMAAPGGGVEGVAAEVRFHGPQFLSGPFFNLKKCSIISPSIPFFSLQFEISPSIPFFSPAAAGSKLKRIRERSHSGLVRPLGERIGPQGPREFESRPLRHNFYNFPLCYNI